MIIEGEGFPFVKKSYITKGVRCTQKILSENLNLWEFYNILDSFYWEKCLFHSLDVLKNQRIFIK